MNTRDVELLLKSVQSSYPIPREPTATVAELLAIINKNPNDEKLSDILFEAVNHGHQEIVQALLAAKVDPNIKNDERSALSIAACYGHLEIMQMLITAKADINAVNTKNTTALFNSIASKKTDAIKLLLAAKADPNIGGKDYTHTPLGYAALTNQVNVVVRLINAGAIVLNDQISELDLLISNNETDLDGNIREGNTHAQLEKALPAINLLLNHGAVLTNNIGLYKYLRVCNQKNPLIADSFKKLCEYTEKSCGDAKKDDVYKDRILKPTYAYLKKLQVVMQYKPKKIPAMISMAPWAADHDRIAWSIAYHEPFDAKEVEDLYERLCAKQHPWLYPFGLAPAIEPVTENEIEAESKTEIELEEYKFTDVSPF